MTPKVSVIIPTYNHSHYILETLQSVFDQNFTDYEIIVVNDGSPDDAAQILAPLVAQGEIEYIEQPNAGQAAARNRGLARAQGEFIAFLDDDDLWPPDKLEWQTACLEAHSDVVFVSGTVQEIDDQGREWGRPYGPMGTVSFESLFGGNPFISPGQILIRASAFQKTGGLNTTLWGTDDFDLWFRLAQHGKIVTSPRLALFYRRHSGNASRNATKMFVNCLKTVKIHLEKVPRRKRAWFYRGIYRSLYLGMTRSVVQDLRINKWRAMPAVWPQIPQFLYLIGPMFCDRVLLKHIVQDLMPKSLKRVWQLMSKRANF